MCEKGAHNLATPGSVQPDDRCIMEDTPNLVSLATQVPRTLRTFTIEMGERFSLDTMFDPALAGSVPKTGAGSLS